MSSAGKFQDNRFLGEPGILVNSFLLRVAYGCVNSAVLQHVFPSCVVEVLGLVCGLVFWVVLCSVVDSFVGMSGLLG